MFRRVVGASSPTHSTVLSFGPRLTKVLERCYQAGQGIPLSSHSGSGSASCLTQSRALAVCDPSPMGSFQGEGNSRGVTTGTPVAT